MAYCSTTAYASSKRAALLGRVRGHNNLVRALEKTICCRARLHAQRHFLCHLARRGYGGGAAESRRGPPSGAAATFSHCISD
jgi:hypothetical protein